MPQVIAESPSRRQAKSLGEFETNVAISALFRRCDKFQLLENNKVVPLTDKSIVPSDLWSYHQIYEISVKARSGKRLYKRVRASQCRPRVRLQHLSKWRFYPIDESDGLGQVASDSTNRRLNLLLENPERLIRTESLIQQVSLDSKAPDIHQFPGLARKAPFLGARHLLRISTELSVTEVARTARQLAKIRQGGKGRNSDWQHLLSLELDPLKLLEAALGSGSKEFLCELQRSGRLPVLEVSLLERLGRRPQLWQNIHLLGNLPPSAQLMYFFARIKNSEGLQLQISQSIPWAGLLEHFHHYREDQRAMNFLGRTLPIPKIARKESSNAAVRKNLASCAYQFSGGFNLLTPTVTALLEGGAGIEDCLKYCPANRGIALKKFILENFNNLRSCFHKESPDTFYQRLAQEPDLAKTTYLSKQQVDAAEVQLF